jgi:hypothetical protein
VMAFGVLLDPRSYFHAACVGRTPIGPGIHPGWFCIFVVATLDLRHSWQYTGRRYCDELGETEMTTKAITLQVDADLAQVYQSAPAADRTKLQLLMNLWLRELSTRSTSLAVLMDELSDKARARGLTAEKLEEMLRER